MHLDLSYIKENITDDPAFIEQVLRVFLSTVQRDLDMLRSEVHNQNPHGVKQAAHKVKSSFRSLGMKELTNAFQDLEDVSASGEWQDRIQSKFDEIDQEAPNAINEVERYLAG